MHSELTSSGLTRAEQPRWYGYGRIRPYTMPGLERFRVGERVRCSGVPRRLAFTRRDPCGIPWHRLQSVANKWKDLLPDRQDERPHVADSPRRTLMPYADAVALRMSRGRLVAGFGALYVAGVGPVRRRGSVLTPGPVVRQE